MCVGVGSAGGCGTPLVRCRRLGRRLRDTTVLLRFFAACAGELAVVRWVAIVICLLCCAYRSLVRLGSCADLLSPPALLCQVAVCLGVPLRFGFWIFNALCLFI